MSRTGGAGAHDPLTDPLTGLGGRRALELQLERQVGHGAPGALLCLDLDHFKTVNDRFGHGVGDGVLVTVAARLRAVCPEPAAVFRLGGDEFVVLLADCGLDEAAAVARTAASAVAEPMPMDGALRVITVSVGVARTPRSAWHHSLAVADRCLYAAKTRRRGDVVTEGDLGEVGQGRRDLTLQFHQLQDQRDALAVLAITDELTGLRNRRAFDRALTTLHAAASSQGRPYAVVYMDLDRFHQLNRARGDEAGDGALRTCAQALAGSCRTAADVVYRKGGEELVALLPETSLGDALDVAERMRLAVVASAVPYTDEAGADVVTISGGIASFDPGFPRSADEVVGAANRAMVAAKEQGRNRMLPG